jgi:hypothetical protein
VAAGGKLAATVLPAGGKLAATGLVALVITRFVLLDAPNPHDHQPKRWLSGWFRGQAERARVLIV